MKKMKKFAALFLCLCMLMTSAAMAMPAAAGEAEDEYMEARNQLNELYTYVKANFFSLDCGPEPIYTEATLRTLSDKMFAAKDCLEAPDPTLDELKLAYQELQDALDGLKIRTDILQELCDITGKEENYKNYYEESLWTPFQTALHEAEAVLLAPDDDTVTDAYFALRTRFNDLCKCNRTPGDLDRDGKVSVQDVLYLQKYLAKLVPINSSQIFVSDFTMNYLGDITTENVLKLQRYLAGAEAYIASSELNSLINSDANRLIDHLP